MILSMLSMATPCLMAASKSRSAHFVGFPSLGKCGLLLAAKDLTQSDANVCGSIYLHGVLDTMVGVFGRSMCRMEMEMEQNDLFMIYKCKMFSYLHRSCFHMRFKERLSEHTSQNCICSNAPLQKALPDKGYV
jgi:hypothetical protein